MQFFIILLIISGPGNALVRLTDDPFLLKPDKILKSIENENT